MGKKHWNEPWNGGAEIRPGIPRLRGLTESLPVAAMVADPLGSPLVVNDRFRDLLGDPPTEGWLSLVEPSERASAESVWLLAGIARAMREVELGFVGTAGPFRATCRIAPLEEEGRVLGWAITLAEAAPDLSASVEAAFAGRTEAEERLRSAEERGIALEDRLAAAELRQRDLEEDISRGETRRHETEAMLEAAELRRRQLEELLAASEAARLEVEERLAEAEAQLHGVADRLAEAEARRGEVEAHLAGVEAARLEVEARLAQSEADRRETEERLVDSEAQRRELADLLADSEARTTEADARVALADAHRREAEWRQAEAESRLAQATALLGEIEERCATAEQALSLARAERDRAADDRDEARALAESWAEAAADAEARLAEALARAEAAPSPAVDSDIPMPAFAGVASESPWGAETETGSAEDAEAGTDEPPATADAVTPVGEPVGTVWAAEPFHSAAEQDHSASLGDPFEDVSNTDTRFASDMSRAFAAMQQDHEIEEPELAGVVALGEAAESGMAVNAGSTSEDEAIVAEGAEPAAPAPDRRLAAETDRDVGAELVVAEPEATEPALSAHPDHDLLSEPASDHSPGGPELAMDATDVAPAPEPELATEGDHGDASPAEVTSEDREDDPREPSAALDAEVGTVPQEREPAAWNDQGDAAEVESEAPSLAEHQGDEHAGILEPDDGPELDQLAARLRSGLLRAALGRWRAGRGRSGVTPFQLWDEASTEAGQVVIEMDEAGVPVRLRVVRSLDETPLLRALSAPPGGEGHGWRRCAASGRPAHDYAEVGLGPDGGHSLERLLLPFGTQGASVDRLVLLLVTEEVGQAEPVAMPLP